MFPKHDAFVNQLLTKLLPRGRRKKLQLWRREMLTFYSLTTEKQESLLNWS